MADFGATDLDAFRETVRRDLAQMYPSELLDPAVKSDPEAVWGGRAFVGSNDPQITWMTRMAAKGWTTPSWPSTYGGGGLSPDEARVLENELATGGYRPPVLAFGI